MPSSSSRPGRDALECNIYSIAANPELTSREVEQEYIDILRSVKSAVKTGLALR